MAQNLNQDMTGGPLPVTLVDSVTSLHLQNASKVGYSTLQDGTQVGSLDLFSAILNVLHFPMMNVIILNSLPTPLSLVTAYPKHGHQTAYPAISNLVGGTALNPHEIPASRPNPLNPGSMLYGVGLYGFEDDGAGSAGAMVFSYKAKLAGPFIGVSWRYGLAPFYSDQAGVAADLVKYGNDAQSFYDNTADGSTTPLNQEIGSETTVTGTLACRNYLDDDPRVGGVYGILTFWVQAAGT